MRILILYLLLYAFSTSYGQLPEVSKNWEKEHVASRLSSKDLKDYLKYDFSNILSNQNRFEGDGWSSYTGFFGPKNRRIDFHLLATKISPEVYSVTGKSKLGENIRELSGKIVLLNAYITNWKAHVITFKYELNEPGDKDGDGKFVGIGSIAFQLNENNAEIFWSAAGDYREYNNVFVGEWQRFNSSVTRECIFTFYVSGTHNKLVLKSELFINHFLKKVNANAFMN
ncbi:hypothetical protein GCM10027429_24920 [Marivirga atlantica]|jgi:hypothetical protein|uniref:Uncharacterized protein n=1 Tax=Marivirga atlantica TaxID=1548457 RepID=A0A937ANU0_9BACT|nr:hypothetical protein [Marivirga atlantica]MBL0766092.1 hypothetical protein [Marivirga atlantica]